MGTVDTVILIIIFLAGFGAMVWFIVGMIRFRHKLNLYDPTSTGNKYIETSAREYVDDDGILWWKLKSKINQLDKVPKAPSECVSIGKLMGLFKFDCATGYVMEDGIYWAKHPAIKSLPNKFDSIIDVVTNWEINNNVPKDETILSKREAINKLDSFNEREKEYKNWREDVISQWKKINGVDFVFYPLDSNQRVVYANNYRKAEEKRNHDWKDKIVSLGYGLLVAFVLTMLIVFYPDLGKVGLSSQQNAIQYEKAQTATLETLERVIDKLDAMDKDIQIIKQESDRDTNIKAPN